MLFRSPSQTHLELQQHSWRRDPKCTGLQQLMVLAAGQQRAPGTCNQRPRTLCRVCDLCVPATQCLPGALPTPSSQGSNFISTDKCLHPSRPTRGSPIWLGTRREPGRAGTPPSRTPLPPPSPPHPSGLSQSTSFECPASSNLHWSPTNQFLKLPIEKLQSM